MSGKISERRAEIIARHGVERRQQLVSTFNEAFDLLYSDVQIELSAGVEVETARHGLDDESARRRSAPTLATTSSRTLTCPSTEMMAGRGSSRDPRRAAVLVWTVQGIPSVVVRCRCGDVSSFTEHSEHVARRAADAMAQELLEAGVL